VQLPGVERGGRGGHDPVVERVLGPAADPGRPRRDLHRQGLNAQARYVRVKGHDTRHAVGHSLFAYEIYGG